VHGHPPVEAAPMPLPDGSGNRIWIVDIRSLWPRHIVNRQGATTTQDATKLGVFLASWRLIRAPITNSVAAASRSVGADSKKSIDKIQNANPLTRSASILVCASCPATAATGRCTV
jgi:hypothetical protein